MSVPRPALSVVIPCFDEQENLPVLHAELVAVLEGIGRTWEIVYVDDHSRDRSLAVMLGLRRDEPRVRIVAFQHQAGQTAAMAAGFEQARGELVVTLDGDLQNDPADIPALLARLDEGFDVVAGWRKRRQDGFVLRRLPSILANRLIARVTGVPIHDTGCTLKVFRRTVIEAMPIYAEQHRFLPAISARSGARVSELVVNHRARRFGRSKYGLGRATRVLLDLLTIKMIASFTGRPLQYFALLALPFALGTVVLLVTGLTEHDGALSGTTGQILVLAYLLTFMACVYFLMLGLLAELAVRASNLHGDRTRNRILGEDLHG